MNLNFNIAETVWKSAWWKRMGFTVLFGLAVAIGCGTPSEQASPQQPVSKVQPPQTPSVGDMGAWPMSRGSIESTGVAASDLPQQLEILWEKRITKHSFEATPVVAEVSGKQTICLAGSKGSIYMIDLKSGDLIRSVPLNDSPGFSAPVAIFDEHFYVGDLLGSFLCLDSSGEIVWTAKAGSAIDSCPNFSNGIVTFGSRDAKIYGFDAKTGEKAFVLLADNEIRSTPSIIDGKAFYGGCDLQLSVIDLEECVFQNKIPLPSESASTPAPLGDVVYLGTYRSGLYAVNWKTGVVEWVWPTEDGSQIKGSPSVNASHVIFGAEDQLYSLHPKTGEFNWSVSLKSMIKTSPVIVGDRVFVTAESRLYGISLANGEIAFEKEFEGLLTSPAVAFGRLIVASDEGTVYCLGERE